jgi:hypothetical protein
LNLSTIGRDVIYERTFNRKQTEGGRERAKVNDQTTFRVCAQQRNRFFHRMTKAAVHHIMHNKLGLHRCERLVRLKEITQSVACIQNDLSFLTYLCSKFYLTV